MGKALKTVGVIIGAAALIATGVGALAMPALAGTTTLFGVSVGTLNTISSGLVAVGGMLDKPKSQGSASPDEWTSNPDQPIPFLMGRMGVAGKIVQRDEFGPDNMYQGIVGILSGAGPIRAVTSFAGDKQPVSFGANGIAVTSQWEGEMWMVRRSGAQPDTVLTVPAGLKTGGSAFEWSSAAKLSGKACYLQVLGENSKGTAFPAGIPDPVHVAEGIFGYDPRYDDTYPGGAGSCRLGVRSTYRWIEDGGIGGLNWALGLVENGQVVGGIGASIDGIDVPAFVEVANIADTNGWKLAAWPDTSEDVSAVLDQLLQAAGAVRARHAGKISCVSRGAPRASVATITARDTAGDIELDTAPSLFNRLNTITPRFMSEAAGWVLTPANPVAFAQYVTDDGGKHGDQIDYRFVPLLKQAAELAAYDILDAREPFSGTIPLKAHMRHLKRGDTFEIDEPGFLMDGVKCIVLSRSYDPKTAQVRIGFRSETDSKHALALGKTTTLPDFPTLTPTDPTIVSPPLPEDWVIVVRPPAPGGTQLPGFDLTGIVSNSTATAIIVEYGPSATGPWKQAYQGPPTVTNIPIDGLQPGATYYVAIQYQRNQNYSTREVYGPYTAPALIGDVMPNAPGLSQIKSDIEAAFGDIFAVDALLADARADIDAQGVEIAAARGGQPNLNSRILQLNQARIDGDAANASAISLVQARTANAEAEIIDLENALATETLTRAQAVQRVTAQVAGAALNKNSTYANWPTGQSMPDFIGSFGSGLTVSRGVGKVSPNSIVIESAAGSTNTGIEVGFAQTNWNGRLPIVPSTPAYWVIDYKIEIGTGGLSGPMFRFLLTNASTGVATSATYSKSLSSLHTSTGDDQILEGSHFFRCDPNAGSPSAQTARLALFGHSSAGGAYNRIIAHKMAVRPATASDIAAQVALPATQATVTTNSLAIIDLENSAAIASWQVKAVATGGKPAILEVVSSTAGSYVAIGGEQIFLGENTTIDTVSQTQQGLWGSTRRVIANGPPFGPDNLIHWSGPSSIALSAMTKANAGFWQDQTGAYGPTPLPSFWARVTPTQITRSRTGAGSISTAVNDVIVTCYTGTSGATCTWSRVSGDPTISFPATGFTPTFSTTVALGQIKTALFVGLVAKGGDVDLVYVNVEFQENT